MLVLQSCTDSLSVLPSSSSETLPTSFDGTYDVGNIEVDEDIDMIEESFIAVNKQVDIGKQEEISKEITFSHIKSEPNKVSYVCLCVFYPTHFTTVQIFFKR
jgi:hypothetical protein